eukprot:scaffold306443_cov26-Tisochrysis_lutea.AAC.2
MAASCSRIRCRSSKARPKSALTAGAGAAGRRGRSKAGRPERFLGTVIGRLKIERWPSSALAIASSPL